MDPHDNPIKLIKQLKTKSLIIPSTENVRYPGNPTSTYEIFFFFWGGYLKEEQQMPMDLSSFLPTISSHWGMTQFFG